MLPLYHDIDQHLGADGGIGKEHGKIEQCVSKREREREGWVMRGSHDRCSSALLMICTQPVSGFWTHPLMSHVCPHFNHIQAQ